MKTLEVKAGTVEEAIEKGLTELGKTREEVDIEIADAGGFLKKAKVVLTLKPSESENALEFLQQLLKKMNLTVTVDLKEDEEKSELIISGKDSGNVIGYRGDVLDAIQYIISVTVNKNRENYKKIIVDCENYRAKRTETLVSLAGKLAEKAVFKGRKVTLEPMNPFERRVIHSALQDNKQVTTESEGTEPNRYIVITPKNLKPYTAYSDNKPYNRDNRPYGRDSYGGGFRKDSGFKRENREGGFNRDNREGGFNRDNREGGFNRDNREGGFNRDNREGGFNRDNREGGFNRDNRQGGFGGGRTSAPKKNSFNSFGTYLGNSKSGFSSDNDFTKKSGFDNLKD